MYLATPQKPVTPQVQVVVCPWVWNSETVPVPVETVTMTPQSNPYPCYTLTTYILSIYCNNFR